MISRILGLIFVMIFSLRVSAGVFIEPVVGYAMGGPENSSTSYDSTGLMYGGRGGFSTMGFDIGAEYLMGQLEWEKGGVTTNADHTYISAYVGYSLPVMLGVRAGYVFSNKYKTSSGENTGSGFSLGVAYSVMPFVKLNFDYKMLKYDDNSVKDNEMFFSLSAPIGF